MTTGWPRGQQILLGAPRIRDQAGGWAAREPALQMLLSET